MDMVILKRIFNRLIRHFMISQINSSDKDVYLTFDDGPEPVITEFVLDELNKYGYKATFFCRGDNAQKYPELLQRIKDEGHSIGNHTYSHLHAFDVSAKKYSINVDMAKNILHTNVFRPPHGRLTLGTWLRIHKDNHIYFWSLNSGDSDMEKYDYNRSIGTLKNRTKAGDIVLFHFCHKHSHETMELLPIYLKWLNENLYKSKALV